MLLANTLTITTLVEFRCLQVELDDLPMGAWLQGVHCLRFWVICYIKMRFLAPKITLSISLSKN